MSTLSTSDHDARANNNDTTKEIKSRPPCKHTRSKKMDPKVLSIRRQIQLGCRDNDLEAAMKVYDEAVQADIHLEAQTFYSLLNLCDGLERTVHVGTPKAACDASAGTASPVPISHIDNRTPDAKNSCYS